MLNLPATTTRHEVVLLRGGLDLLTPTLTLKPGACREAQNFECSITGGYTRIKGYERFDGRPSPSDAVYRTLTVTITGSISAGNTIVGATSTATGKVIYRGGNIVVYTKLTGTFQNGEVLTVSAVPQATITALSGTIDEPDFSARMRALAADVYRADIGAVPGTGVIRGVVYFGGVVYAFRDNAGGTALAVYKGTSGGWSAVAMANTVTFTAGTSEYVDGETLAQGGASATIRRVCLESGTWAGGTAAGRLVIGTVTGGPFAAGAAVGGGACTLSGAETAITLSPGGSIEFDIGAVGGARRVYMVDAINHAWEFDGTYLVPIVNTGMGSDDKPTHVMVHAGHLFLSYSNSFQWSAIGNQFSFAAADGAGELLADGPITVMRRLQGDQSSGAAAIANDKGLQILYGTDAESFRFVTFEDSAGAKARSGQLLGRLYCLDDRGVVDLVASQTYGNFTASSLTLPVRPYIQTRRNLVTGSLVNREKSQYRLFFSDGSGLYVTIANGKLLGSMPIRFPDIVRCCCAGETPDGIETAFFGSDSGWVYRLDAGTSFDGDAIDYFFRIGYTNQSAPRQIKRYRKVTAEVIGSTYASFGVAAYVDYQSDEREQWDIQIASGIQMTAAFWDSMRWDAFTWDGRVLRPSEVGIDSSGENVAIRLAGASAIYDSFTVNSLIISYSPRRNMR